MEKFEFAPPSRDPSMDIVSHVWATKYAITCWETNTPRFIKICISEEVEDLLRFHPSLTERSIVPATLRSVYGITIEVDKTLPGDPGYVIHYERSL